jgi:DNA modification methylase
MPASLVEFFVKFLTDEGDTVLDPFSGSNTTGAVAQRLGRRWVSIEADWSYAAHSIGRFDPTAATSTCREIAIHHRDGRAGPAQVPQQVGYTPVTGGTS